MQHCFRLGLYRQGLLHDMSKYSLVEFLSGIKYYQGNRSPNEAERTEKGYSAAWLHHKGRNKHHMEYWIDYPGNGKAMEGVEMPLCYVAEMFCDRVAASKTYLKDQYHDGSPWEYYAQRHDHYWLHPNTRNILETMLQTLRDQGEEKAFSYIRKEILNK
ncbi:catalase [bacterium 1XD42-1]|nr:catalase [bacterium 1XD42-8]RKJ63819.1 catalase [bacterium 1XD42-1]